MKLTTIKKIGLISVVALVLNFAAGTLINKSINKKRTALKNQISQITGQSQQLDLRLSSVLEEVESLKPDYALLKPFWHVYKTYDKLNKSLKNLPMILKEYAHRKLYIGYASEGRSREDFISELEQANSSLIKHGIFLELKEHVEVKLPRSFSIEDFAYGAKHSFDHPQDYYFVWTTTDYSQGKNDYAAKALTKNRVCLIDDDFPKESLDELITQEVLRLFTGKGNVTVQNNKDEAYFIKIDKEKIIQNLTKVFRDEEYQLGVNLEKRRTVTVNIGLDGVTQQYAQELLSSVSQVYEKEFNISLEPLGFYTHKLPKSWSIYNELGKLKNVVLNKSDVYVLLTSNDWIDNDDEGSSSIMGQASSGYGYLWIETHQGREATVVALAHEIGHLFGAEHVYRKNSVMHPYNSTQLLWTPKSKETILKNKFTSSL